MPRRGDFFCTNAGFTLSDLAPAFFATRFFAAVFFVLAVLPVVFLLLACFVAGFFVVGAPASDAGTTPLCGTGFGFAPGES